MNKELLKEIEECNFVNELKFNYKGHIIEVWINPNDRILTILDGKEVARSRYCDISYNHLQSLIDDIDKKD